MTDVNDPHRLVARVTNLENWRHEVDTERAVYDLKGEHANKQFDSIEKRLDKIDAHISKMVWLILTAIIGAFMAFLISGGFNLG